MKLVVLAVGRLREPALRSVADDYLGRIRRFCRCDEVELRSEDDLAHRWPPEAWRILLDADGDRVSSVELSRRLERWSSSGKGDAVFSRASWRSSGKGVVAFAIGGAEGFSSRLPRDCEARLSLSTLTLPHRLARIVLFEQLYRSLTLIRNVPYAREA